MIADGTTVVLALCDRTAAHATPCAPSAAPHAQPVWASASDTVSAGGRIAKPMRRTLFDVNSISGLIFLLMSNLPSRVTGQNGGLAKVDSGFDYAANFCSLACVA